MTKNLLNLNFSVFSVDLAVSVFMYFSVGVDVEFYPECTFVFALPFTVCVCI